MDTLTGIPRRYLHDTVADHLRALIRSGDIAPGSRLPEVELAERFGISRTPLREAIKILATEGLLELLPNRGARVALISPRDLAEMVEVVGGLEAMAAEAAVTRLTAPELDAIRADHHAMLAAYAARDAGQFFRLNRAIHEAIVAASGNATLIRLYTSLSTRLNPFRYRAALAEADWRHAVEDHNAILSLLEHRNGPALATLLRTHVRGKAEAIAAEFGVGASEVDTTAAPTLP